MKDALSLIREREKRIEELTLEYAGFEAGSKAAARFILAATAHKMHEAIKDRCIKGGVYPAFVARTIENVANELIDNALPANLVSLDDLSKAIKDYCCELIDQGKDAVEVTEFNAEIQKKIKEMCNERST